MSSEKAYVIYSETVVENEQNPEFKILGSNDEEAITAAIVEEVNASIENIDTYSINYIEVDRNVKTKDVWNLIDKTINEIIIAEEDAETTDGDKECSDDDVD